MAIRTKIALAMAVLLPLAVAVIGFVTVQTVTNHLTDQVDEKLLQYAERWRRAGTPAGDPAKDLGYSEFAIMFFDDSGDTLLESVPSGFASEPDPLPDLAEAPRLTGVYSVGSEDDSVDYRAVTGTWRLNDSRYLVVIATPLTEVDATVATLTRTVLVTGLVVAAIGMTAAWIITRRGLRPVDRMVSDAETVAAGNLAHRISPADPRTEMGRLSMALDRMVERLTAAIAERDRQHERLRQFVADAGHELRTPLTAIGGYVQLYQSGVAAHGEKLDRAMDRIGSENARLARLVDDLMTLSRLDQEVGGDRELVELDRLARDAVDDAAVADPDHPVELDARAAATVVADEGQLRQVLVNLLSNARVHTPAGTRIEVTVDVEGDWALLRVADQGPGIPAEHRRKVFDRFYRADPSRSRSTGGSGLGLAIVTSIVAGHGGELSLRSEEGRGTAVEVRLPLARFES